MLIMRIKENFAPSRKSEIREYKPKYFIASEGSCSEPRYFEGLSKSIITENIRIINILRDFATKNNSHPSFIIKILKEFILNTQSDQITLREIRNRIDNFNKENGNKFDMRIIDSLIKNNYGNDYTKEFYYDDLQEIICNLFKSEVYESFAKYFVDYLNSQNVTYVKNIDTLNMVIDRDSGNFFPEQYDEVKEFCELNDVNLYVSNPNFEFWLLLHFDEVENENKEIMYKNDKVNSKRRYLENRLHEICGYKKKNLNFTVFEPFVSNAIKREKKYAETLVSLKDNLGSNVGILVEKMINQNNSD